jgi:hypothetical protein
MESFDMRFLREKVEMSGNREFGAEPAESPLIKKGTEDTGTTGRARNPLILKTPP